MVAVGRRRLLLVDDDLRFCALAAPLLEDFDVRFAHRADDAATLEASFAPEVVVVDLGLPDGDGIDVIARLSCARPELAILVLSVANASPRILAALRAGARGYIFKEDIARLRRSVDEVLGGESPMSASVAQLVLAQLRSNAPVVPGAEPRGVLTPRELAVVDRLREGLSYEEVGAALGVTTNTVRSYIRSVYEKLQVSSKTEAVVEALRRGWLA